MSFQQGLSGLNAASKTLEVIGNNVANASTVGFKQSQTVFADVFASSLTGGGASQIGIGTKLSQVAQQFTQGNVSATGNPLDMSINGNGFFRVQAPSGGDFYTRNGQFQMNEAGYIVSSTGMLLTGYPSDGNGGVNNTVPTPVPLQISFDEAPPKATTSVALGMNLDSKEVTPSSPFDFTDAQSYNHTTSVSVYDSLGNPHVMQTYYVKTDPQANQWSVYGVLDGAPIRYTPPSTNPPVEESHLPIAVLTFDSSGKLSTEDKTAWDAFRSAPPTPPMTDPLSPGNGAARIDFALSFAGATQYSGGFSVNELKQDGYSSGQLAGYSVGSDGIIEGRYTNGVSRQLGQVALVKFSNPNGLQAAGNNVWQPTGASGEPMNNQPGTGNTGLLQASSVEESNVDLTSELVKMITAQRNYQANAQTIKTQDQAMQTLMNMR